MHTEYLRRWLFMLPLLLLGACTTLPPDHGRDDVAALLEADGFRWDDSLPDLQGMLNRATAITRALTANPLMQVEYQRLNISAADVVRAAELTNPRFSASAMFPHKGGGVEWGIGISQSLSGILMHGLRRDMAETEYRLASLHLARVAQRLALDTEAAWFALVEAEQRLAVHQLIARADRLADALAGRFQQAGNLHDFARTRYAERSTRTDMDLLRAQRERDLTRDRLAGLMVVSAGDNDWQVPTQLPLPLDLDGLDESSLIAQAQSQRPDMRILVEQQHVYEQGLVLARRYRWLGDLEVGIKHEREADGARLTGPALALGLPLLHRNQASVLRAEGQAALAQALLLKREQDVVWEVRHALYDLRHQAALFEMRSGRLLPQHATLVKRRQERVNFMVDGIFDLLDSKREELRAWHDQVAGLGQFWQHWIALSRALGSYPPVDDEQLQKLEARMLDTSVLERNPAHTNPDYQHHEQDVDEAAESEAVHRHHGGHH